MESEKAFIWLKTQAFKAAELRSRKVEPRPEDTPSVNPKSCPAALPPFIRTGRTWEKLSPLGKQALTPVSQRKSVALGGTDGVGEAASKQSEGGKEVIPRPLRNPAGAGHTPISEYILVPEETVHLGKLGHKAG